MEAARVTGSTVEPGARKTYTASPGGSPSRRVKVPARFCMGASQLLPQLSTSLHNEPSAYEEPDNDQQPVLAASSMTPHCPTYPVNPGDEVTFPTRQQIVTTANAYNLASTTPYDTRDGAWGAEQTSNDPVSLQQGKQCGRTGVDLGYENAPTSIPFLIRLFFKNCWRSLKMGTLMFKLSGIDIRQRPCAYCLGFMSVFVVVVVCISLLSILSALPVVFQLIAEANRGMIDLTLSPGSQLSSATTLNYSMVRQMFPPDGDDVAHSYHTPRTTLSATANVLWRCPNVTKYEDLWVNNLTGEHCTDKACVSSQCPGAVSITLIAFDAAREQRMQLATNRRVQAPPDGAVIISRQLAFLLGDVRSGDPIFIYARTLPILRQAFPQSTPQSDSFVVMQVVVEEVMSDFSQKFPNSGETFALVDYNNLPLYIARGLSPSLNVSVSETVASSNAEDYAQSILFNLEPGEARRKVYQSRDFNSIRRDIMRWANPIVIKVGYNQVVSTAPIVVELYFTRMFSVFITMIMALIILALALLSIMLIYSLLTVGIETRTYELGIQRMIGFTRENLVASVLCNAYCFTIPAWLLGLGGGQGLYTLIRFVFNIIAGVQLPLAVSGSSIGWATLAGLLIPLAASIFPILSLVTLRLPEALDATRSRSTGVVYKIQRSTAERLNGTMLGLGLLFAVFGFLLYFLFPKSVINENLPLMIYILFFVLMGMLTGLVLLATNFERVVETVLLHVLLFWEGRSVYRMARKSLASHRLRNRKTTLMYALSLSFITFITVAFQIELQSIVYNTRRSYGGEVRIGFNHVDLLHYGELREYVQTTLISRGVATGITYTPYTYTELWNADRRLRGQGFSSIGRFRTASTTLHPVPPDYYEVLDTDFLKVSHRVVAARRYSLSGVLYTRESSASVLMSTSAFKFLGVEKVQQGVVILSNTIMGNGSTGSLWHQRTPIVAAASMDATPVLAVSNFPSVFGDSMASFPTATRLTGDSYQSALVVPLRWAHVRVPDAKNYGIVVETIARWDTRAISYVSDVDDATKNMRDAGNILSIFFILTQVIILVICFFSLMSSMTSNVLESSKEIAVLLCMGMTHFQLYRVYIWEAFILVLASGLLGLLVGTVVAYTMQMQNVLTTQLPLPFAFPYIQLCIVAGVGLVSAIVSSVSPIAFLLGMPSITHILRRTLG